LHLKPEDSDEPEETIPDPSSLQPFEPNIEYKIEAILKKRQFRGKTKYLVRWKGYGPESDTWEPEENFGNAQEILADFNQKHQTRKRHGSEDETKLRGG
jgi:hypothetical protein